MKRRPGSQLRILVGGMLAGVPGHGGASWTVLQYLIGLRRLGHDVWFAEPVAEGVIDDPAVARYFEQLCQSFDLDQAAMLESGSSRSLGREVTAIADAAHTADLVIDLAGTFSGAQAARTVVATPLLGAPVKAYVDLDPAFTQLWHSVDGIDMGFIGHTHFFTVGLGIGTAQCPVPTCGRSWLPTLPPVVLPFWPAVPAPSERCLTTIANWRGYGSVWWNGVHYGQKCHSFRTLASLPGLVDVPLLLAAGVDESEPDKALLVRERWHLSDPTRAAGTPSAYQAFIQQSWAEFGLAKSGYVTSQCGWFSDRSVCYLASGRPVVAQDTGFSRHLPTGQGLLGFTSIAEAADVIHRVVSDYERHAAAARAIAEEHLDADRVLRCLIERTAVA